MVRITLRAFVKACYISGSLLLFGYRFLADPVKGSFSEVLETLRSISRSELYARMKFDECVLPLRVDRDAKYGASSAYFLASIGLFPAPFCVRSPSKDSFRLVGDALEPASMVDRYMKRKHDLFMRHR